jgi:DNA-binding response OmpR family regulator
MSTVLIVEDDAPLASWFSRVLEHNGYQSTWADTCEKAIDTVSANCPDLVVMDVILPDGNGLDLISWMSTDPNCELLPVIAVSSGDFKPQAKAHGAAQFLRKPISMETLLETVRAELAGR